MMARVREEVHDVWCMLTRRCEWVDAERIKSDDATIKWLKEQEREAIEATKHLPSVIDAMQRKGDRR